MAKAHLFSGLKPILLFQKGGNSKSIQRAARRTGKPRKQQKQPQLPLTSSSSSSPRRKKGGKCLFLSFLCGVCVVVYETQWHILFTNRLQATTARRGQSSSLPFPTDRQIRAPTLPRLIGPFPSYQHNPHHTAHTLTPPPLPPLPTFSSTDRSAAAAARVLLRSPSPSPLPARASSSPATTTPQKQPWSIKSAKPSGTHPYHSTDDDAASGKRQVRVLPVPLAFPPIQPPNHFPLSSLPPHHTLSITARPPGHRQARPQCPDLGRPPPRDPSFFLLGRHLPLHRCCRCCPRRTRPRRQQRRQHCFPPPLLCLRPVLFPHPHQQH